jgi:hypothetical protein
MSPFAAPGGWNASLVQFLGNGRVAGRAGRLISRIAGIRFSAKRCAAAAVTALPFALASDSRGLPSTLPRALNDLLKKHGKRQSVENPLLD